MYLLPWHLNQLHRLAYVFNLEKVKDLLDKCVAIKLDFLYCFDTSDVIPAAVYHGIINSNNLPLSATQFNKKMGFFRLKVNNH